jgi:hypothetical protein
LVFEARLIMNRIRWGTFRGLWRHMNWRMFVSMYEIDANPVCTEKCVTDLIKSCWNID